MRRGFIAAICLFAALGHAQGLVQVPSKRAITGAPPLYQSQPDREIPGRFVGFTSSGCALSFGAAAVRGLTWTGACPGGRMQGEGMVIGYDYEQQPVFVFEGYVERGLRQSGANFEIDRKDGVWIGWRIPIVGSVLQPRIEMRFLDLPRPFLLALDDWNFQTDGKDLLASMGAPWAPVRQPAAPTTRANADQGVRDGLGTLLGAIGEYQQARQGRQSASAQAGRPSGAGACERKEFKIVSDNNYGSAIEMAHWTANSCGRVLYRNRGALTDIAYQNSCGCNVVMYVANDSRADVHLKAYETTSFNNPRTSVDRNLPKETGSCDTEGMGGDFPAYRQETNTCRVRACSLNGTCTNRSSTTR